MPELNYVVPTVGQSDSTEEPLIPIALSAVKTLLNGGLDEDNISPSMSYPVSQLSGLNSGQLLVGNASNIAEARTLSGDITVSNTGVANIGVGKVSNSHLSSTSVTPSKVVRPTILSSTSTMGAIPTVGTPSGASVTATQTGLHLVLCSGTVMDDTNSTDNTFITSTMLKVLTVYKTNGFTLHKENINAVHATISHFDLVVVNSGENVTHALNSNRVGGEVWNDFVLQMICLSQ